MDAPRIPDEFEIFEEIYNYRQRIQHLEREYLDLRIQLRDVEFDLRSDMDNRELKAQVDYLKSRLKDLESRYPWISTGRSSEVAFCINQSGGI
jgi:regulator of replication initiation timing